MDENEMQRYNFKKNSQSFIVKPYGNANAGYDKSRKITI